MIRGTNHRARPPLRQHLLASALATALLGATGASAQDAGVVARTVLRDDPARRIFAELPAPLGLHGRTPDRPAATLPVTNCNDDGPGSLRATIANAADSDVIDLTQLHCGTITLRTGAIPVELDSLTLEGPGRFQLAIDGDARDRVFVHYGGGTLIVNNLTLRDGYTRATDFHVTGGGCIASAGYIELDSSAMTGCYAAGVGSYGGAIYAYGVTMVNSTISDNFAFGVHQDADTAAFGGGAFVYQMYMRDSTISGNRADHSVRDGRESYDVGGGIVATIGGTIVSSTIDSNTSGSRGGGGAMFSSVVVSNSTISGNTAVSELGGGLFVRVFASLSMTSSTVTGNRAPTAGGIWLNRDSSIQSSIVFGNSSPQGDADVGNTGNINNPAALTLISGDHNIIGRADPSITLPADTSHADPLLQPLQQNGGPTRTHALREGSPALDTGSNPDGLVSDQRGESFVRVYGEAPDVGAYEQQAPVAPLPSLPVPALSRWGAGLMALLLATIAGSCHRNRRAKVISRLAAWRR